MLIGAFAPLAHPKPPKGCQASYSRADYHRAAKKAFRAAPYTAHEKRTLKRVIYCTAFPKSVQILRHHHQRYLAAFWVRQLGPARAYAFRLLRNAGQFACLDRLWHHESGWNHRVSNRGGSGAYGIPQALPGSKMASAGSDWASNPRTQIRWGLGYIKGRYGTPCGAWGFWQANHWY